MLRILNCLRTLRPKNDFLLLNKRNAGHSKWANIKHIKAAKDSQRSQLFTKLCQRIKVAIQEGGSANPDRNVHLAQAIAVAKKQSMPTSSIDSCIKAAKEDKTKAQNVWYEIKGPNGCVIIALAWTSNPKKTRDTLAPIIRKNSGVFASSSSKHNFEYKGLIIAKPPEDVKNSMDSAVDDAIECGAEEVNPSEVEEDGNLEFLCEINQLHHVEGKLQSRNYTIKSADFHFIPKLRVELSEEQMQAMSKLIDKLEDHPDIVKLYDNIA